MRKLLAIIFMVLILPGCSLVNWDTRHKKAGNEGPGATAVGNNAKVSYEPDGSVTAEADEWVDKYGREQPGKAEIRKGRRAWAEAWGSDFDFGKIGPANDIEVEAAVDGSGGAVASGSQEPHGWTLQEILLAIGAIVILPLIAGIVLIFIPATKPIGSAILSVYGKIFGRVLNLFKRKEKDNG